MSAIAHPAAAWRTAASSRLQVRVVRTVAEIACAWDRLERTGAGSAYQSCAFLRAWIEHAAAASGIEPFLGLVCDERGDPIALLPFGIKRRGPLRIVMYLGGRDANLQMPVIQPGYVLKEDEARDALQQFAASIRPRPDAFVLTNQPRSWKGVRNPFVFVNSITSPSAAFGDTLGSDIGGFLAQRDSRDTRKKLRSKATRLATLGPVAFGRATPDEVPAIVATFVTQKTARLAARGIDGGLDGDPVRAFLSAIAASPSHMPTLEFYTLRVGTKIAALFGGLPHGGHWHGLINSFTDDPDITRCSPGDMLMRHVLGDLIQRGFASFDLGIGEARYKKAICEERIDLVDTIIPVTTFGRAFAATEQVRLAAKRRIKQTPWAFQAVRRLQRLAGTYRPTA